MKTLETLTHDSLMPTGLHKDKRMVAVPPEYLIWVYENKRCSELVKNYIEANLPSIEKRIERKQITKMYNYSAMRRRTG